MSFLDIFRHKDSIVSSGILVGSQDCHSHILYGVDDGISTLEDSLMVLDYLEQNGVKDLWCTPHIMEDIPNTTNDLQQRFNELQSAYKGSMKLHLGAEYMMDSLFYDRISEGDLLKSVNNMVLVETSAMNPSYNLYDFFLKLEKMGHIPLLAHPERYRFLELRDYENMHKMGVKFQLNLPSLTGFFGETARQKAQALLKRGLYCCYGSDCHRTDVIMRQYNMEELTSEVKETLKTLDF